MGSKKKLDVDDGGKLVMEFALADKKKASGKNFRLKFLSRVIPVKHKTVDEMNETCSGCLEDEEEYIKGYWSPQCDPESIWLLNTVLGHSPDYFILLIHELLEGINDKFGLELRQSDICAIAETFGSLLIENKRHFMNLLRNVRTNGRK